MILYFQHCLLDLPIIIQGNINLLCNNSIIYVNSVVSVHNVNLALNKHNRASRDLSVPNLLKQIHNNQKYINLLFHNLYL